MLLIGCAAREFSFNQTEALPRSGSARHQYGISALVTQASFWEGSNGDLARHRLFSQANQNYALPSLVPDQRNSSQKKITMLGFVCRKQWVSVVSFLHTPPT